MKDKTLEEAFTRVKPEAGHLRIFGCPIYIHVPHEKRSKLDPSGLKGIFFGYSETSKGYRVYVPGHRQIDINRDVTFDEEAVFKRSHESPTEEILRNRRFLFLKSMILIRIMKRFTWIRSQIQSLTEKAIRRDQGGFVILFRMQQDIQLLEGLSEKARGLRDIQGIRP